MKQLLSAVLLALSLSVNAEQGIYLDVGLGYVIDESSIKYESYGFDASKYPTAQAAKYAAILESINSSNKALAKSYDSTAPSAFFALGYEWEDARVEIAHTSNYRQGWPFNSRPEQHRTEIRVVYRFGLLTDYFK